MVDHTCDNGWVHIQHPMRPAGVSMQTMPCHTCNPSGDRPPFQNTEFTIKETDDEDCLASSITTFIIGNEGL